MTFGKALHKLIKNKTGSISSSSICFHFQTLESIMTWVCDESVEEERRDNYTRMINATDWVYNKSNWPDVGELP